jgi:hypothetical protein
MKSKNIFRAVALAAVAAALVVAVADAARAASWRGIEPFASKRADVERVLGVPTADRYAGSGTLQFDVSGGIVTVFFVTPKFMAAKKLPPALEGTVLQIVLQHTSASDTPESLNLSGNKEYEHRRDGKVDVYTNAKEGVAYTFVDNKLRTTRHFYSAAQFQRIQRGS